MKLSTEKTPQQKLSKFVINNVSAINITHLLIHDLKEVAKACDEINQQAGSHKAVPHVAARNIKNAKELNDFIEFCSTKNINKALVIGGSVQRKPSNAFQNDIEVATFLRESGMKVDCGIYPQNEEEIQIKDKLNFFDSAITQLCMDIDAINKLPHLDTISIGIPSMCSVNGIYKYLKICGNNSYKYIFKNWRVISYIGKNGVMVDKLIKKLKFSKFHIYNFGNLDKTISKLL